MGSRVLLVGVVALLAGGCLRDPKANDADGMVADGSSSDGTIGDGGGPDRDPALCTSRLGDQPFPPGGTSAIAPGGVIDIDGDGHEDVLLLVRSATTAVQGVYVLLGGCSGLATKYQHRLLTGTSAPHGLWVGNVHGDSRPELMLITVRVVGSTRETWLQRYRDGVAFDPAGEVRVREAAAPQAGIAQRSQVYVAHASLVESGRHVIISSGSDDSPPYDPALNTLAIVRLGDWASNVANDQDIQAHINAGTGGWSVGPIAVTPRAMPGRDDFMVVNGTTVQLYDNPADNTLGADTRAVTLGGLSLVPSQPMFGDVDEDGRPDVVGAMGGTEASAGGFLSRTERFQSYASPPIFGCCSVGTVHHTVLGHTNGTSRPEFVVLGREVATGSKLWVFYDVSAWPPNAPANLGHASSTSYTFYPPDPQPTFFLMGDLIEGNGHTELALFERDAGKGFCVMLPPQSSEPPLRCP